MLGVTDNYSTNAFSSSDGSAPMFTYRIRIAGTVFEVSTLHRSTRTQCMDYITEDEPNYSIVINEQARDAEKDDGGAHHDAFYATVALQHAISDILLDQDVLLMHGAVIAINNSAYMFSAPSGTGKTTHIRHWLKQIDDAFVVNGDKPFVKLTDTQALACGSPWCGKEYLGSDVMVPLKAIVFLKRSEENRIERLHFMQTYPLLVSQTYIPNDSYKAKQALDLIAKLSDKTEFYRFDCNNFKDDCFDVAYNAIAR